MDIIKAESISARALSGNAAFSDVSFVMKKGEMLAVLGASGAGKSAFAEVLAQLRPLGSGRLEICGFDAGASANAGEIRKRVAFMHQHGEDYFLSSYLDEELSFAPLSLGMSEEETAERLGEVLKLLNLFGLERSSPQLLNIFQRKRVALAAALSAGAELLIMDEPFSGLCQGEHRQMADIIESLREKGISILFCTNRPDEAAMAESVLLLREGSSLAFGTVRDILTDGAALARAGLEPGFALRVFLDLQESGIELKNCPLSLNELVDEICR